MNPIQLLRAIRQAGLSIRLDGGLVRLSPAPAVTPEISAYTAQHKDHLVWLLQRRRPDTPLNEIWVTPQVWEQWLWRIGAYRATPATEMQEAA